MFQIKAGSKWADLLVSEPPESLGDDMAFHMAYDPMLPGFEMASARSANRTPAWIRVEEGEGMPYWVDVGVTPMLLPDRPMTVLLRLWAADVESDT